jgi:hypothetical protein
MAWPGRRTANGRGRCDRTDGRPWLARRTTASS